MDLSDHGPYRPCHWFTSGVAYQGTRTYTLDFVY